MKKSKTKIVRQEIKSTDIPTIFKKVQRISTSKLEPLNNDHLLAEIYAKMDHFREIKSNKLEDEVETDYMNEPIYKSLSNLTLQISKVEDKYLKSIQIERLYEWYSDKLRKLNSIRKINKKTKKSHWEKIYVKTDLKSNFYEAQNYPVVFEKENRTEDTQILPPKDRLKEFLTKHVDAFEESQKTNREKFNQLEEDKQLSRTGSMTNFKSTMYATSNQFNDKFNKTGMSSVSNNTQIFNMNKIGAMNNMNRTTMSGFYNPILAESDPNSNTFYFQNVSNELTKDFNLNNNKEIKSSYNFYRPNYQLQTLNIENNYLKELNQELKNKRTLEENKQYMDKWGKARSQYKSNLNQKQEFIIINKNKVDSKNFLVNKNANVKILKDEQKSEYSKNLHENSKVFEKNLDDENNSDEIIEDKCKPTKLIKVNADNPKVISNAKSNTKKLMNEVLKIKPKIIYSKQDLNNELKLKNEDDIPSENYHLISKLDNVLTTRKLFSSLLNVKKLDNSKNTYSAHFTPLSFYDLKNKSGLKNNENNQMYTSGFRPSTGAEVLRSKTFNSFNLLETRKSISILNENIINQVSAKSNIAIADMKKSIAIPENDQNNTNYMKFFLPDPLFDSKIKITENKK